MPRDRQARAEAPGTSPPAPWTAQLLLSIALPIVLLILALLAALLAGRQPWGSALNALAMLLIFAGALLGGACWARQRQQGELGEARIGHQLLSQMLDVWCWQTDAEHRLLTLQPPQGAPASAWEAGARGELLWQRFQAADDSLRARLQAGAPLGDLRVRQIGQGDAGSPAAPAWMLRGLPRYDASGQFAGFLGVAWPAEATDSPPGVPADTARPVAKPDAAALDRQAAAAEQAAFSYTLSHDLRAPIRVIEGFGRILKEDYAASLDRVGRDHLDRVMAAAARMNHMIDALLSLSRLSALPLAHQPVNLSQLAGFVVDDLRRSSPDRAVAVVIQAGLLAEGDPTLLRLVLENLLGNAWKYSAKVAQAQLVFERVQQGDRAVYQVRDNGAGFDMRFADRLFGVFQRLHSSSDFQGHGVGLASVRRIVQRHGGEVWAEGEVGVGATFSFTLKP